MFAIWQMDNGKIVQSNFPTYQHAEQNCMYPGEIVIEGDWTCDNHWVVQEGEDPPYATERPKIVPSGPLTFKADGVEGIEATEVPAGTWFKLIDTSDRNNRQRQTGTIDDGELEIKSTIERAYKLELDPPFPYQHQEVEIVFNG